MPTIRSLSRETEAEVIPLHSPPVQVGPREWNVTVENIAEVPYPGLEETPIVPADIPDAVAEPGIPFNAVTGANYTGKNVMRLIMAEAEHGFGPGGWAGFGQWRSIGRTVKRGEHGTGLIRMGAETVKHEDGTTSVGKVRPFGARVFHFDQTTELVPAEDGA